MTVEDYDEQIISLLKTRIGLARAEASGRKLSGAPVVSLTEELAVLGKYSQNLGDHGKEVALAILKASKYC